MGTKEELHQSEKELRAELLKEARRLDYNVRRRVQRLEGKDGLPSYAIEDYKEAREYIKKQGGLANMDERHLRNTIRDLTYISKLKSSTVKGATEVQNLFEEKTGVRLRALSPELQSKFWKIYEKAYEAVNAGLEQYKYEVFDTVMDFVYGSNLDEDEVAKKIIDVYDKVIVESAKAERGNEEYDSKLHFTEELENLRKEFD